ncbi:hypothetical protein GW17_00023383, partial [Ensete ventricosum]
VASTASSRCFYCCWHRLLHSPSAALFPLLISSFHFTGTWQCRHCHPPLDAASSFSHVAASCGFFLYQQSLPAAATAAATQPRHCPFLQSSLSPATAIVATLRRPPLPQPSGRQSPLSHLLLLPTSPLHPLLHRWLLSSSSGTSVYHSSATAVVSTLLPLLLLYSLSKGHRLLLSAACSSSSPQWLLFQETSFDDHLNNGTHQVLLQ